MRTQRSQFDTFYFSDFVWGGAAAVDNLFESPGDDNSRAIPHDFPGARRYLFFSLGIYRRRVLVGEPFLKMENARDLIRC